MKREILLGIGAGAIVAGIAVGAVSCGGDEDLNPSGSECAVLSSVHSSSSSSISGNAKQGPLSEYSVDATSSSETVVTPPGGATDCQQNMASRMQGLCAICEQDGAAACESALVRLFDMKETPIDGCEACGDDVCSGTEDVDNCPQDCRTTCGDGKCAWPEAAVCAGGDAECVLCPQDCDNACGDGQCLPPESPQTCPQDCSGGGTCGNNICEATENVATCPDDCAECGDLVCSEPLENTNVCPVDCDNCGDGTCGRSEVGDEAQADPDNDNPLARKIYCPQDCG